MSRTYSDRVMRWRRTVYGKRPGLTLGCRLLLLRLSDDMDAKGIVSVPRSRLADDLDTAPPRITEWIGQARQLGFLDTVRRGRPHVTAVYQATFPEPVGTRGRTSTEIRDGVPHRRDRGTHTLTSDEVRDGVPPNGPLRYARTGTQVVVPSGTSAPCPGSGDETRIDEEASA